MQVNNILQIHLCFCFLASVVQDSVLLNVPLPRVILSRVVKQLICIHCSDRKVKSEGIPWFVSKFINISECVQLIFPLKALYAATLIRIYPNNHVFEGADGAGAVVTKILLFRAAERKRGKQWT